MLCTRITPGIFALFIGLAGCGSGEPNLVCGGLSGALPAADEITAGQVTWVEAGVSNGESGSWNGGSNGDITFGTITLIIAKDETGSDTDALIEAGSFPICIPLGERSAQSGNATDTGAFVTDANHGGHAVILSEDNGEITGRFDFTMGNAGGETRALTNGVFRISSR